MLIYIAAPQKKALHCSRVSVLLNIWQNKALLLSLFGYIKSPTPTQAVMLKREAPT